MSRQYDLLDAFCGEGGATRGYQRAGFRVIGIDNRPMPKYCGDEFIQGDAIEFIRDHGHEFAAIHASPPCKAFTKTGWSYHFGYHDRHENLLTPTREVLQGVGVPWVIENVPGAPLIGHIKLCGSQFGLNLRRHRWFELSSEPFDLMSPCSHPRRGVASPHGRPHYAGEAKDWAVAMQIDWMSPEGLSQAIPPAYTEWIGTQLLASLERAA